MYRMNNLTRYIPDYVLDSMKDVIFIETDNGDDWYYAQQHFAADTLKICFDSKGVIVALGQDASGLWPLGLSVAEVNADSVPDGLSNDGQWLFDGESIVLRASTPEAGREAAEKQKQALLATATAAIAPLQDAVDLDMATEDEKAQLQAWKTYRVLLNRVDTSAPEWPDVPDVA